MIFWDVFFATKFLSKYKLFKKMQGALIDDFAIFATSNIRKQILKKCQTLLDKAFLCAAPKKK